MINCYIGIGNLVRDVDLKQVGEIKFVHNCIAIQRDFTNKTTGKIDCDFVSFKAFGRTAEYLAKYAKKGTKICIKGRWTSESYTIKSGEKRTTICINCDDAYIMGRGDNLVNDDGNEIGENNSPVDDVPDDDLPF